MPRSYASNRAPETVLILSAVRRPSARSTRQTLPNEPPESGHACSTPASGPNAVATHSVTKLRVTSRCVGLRTHTACRSRSTGRCPAPAGGAAAARRRHTARRGRRTGPSLRMHPASGQYLVHGVARAVHRQADEIQIGGTHRAYRRTVVAVVASVEQVSGEDRHGQSTAEC